LFDSFEGVPEGDAAIDGERAIRDAKMLGIGVSGQLRTVPGVYDRFGGDGSLESNWELLDRFNYTVSC
jgi:hypothetical protein